jgi:hypothetical protein
MLLLESSRPKSTETEDADEHGQHQHPQPLVRTQAHHESHELVVIVPHGAHPEKFRSRYVAAILFQPRVVSAQQQRDTSRSFTLRCKTTSAMRLFGSLGQKKGRSAWPARPPMQAHNKHLVWVVCQQGQDGKIFRPIGLPSRGGVYSRGCNTAFPVASFSFQAGKGWPL